MNQLQRGSWQAAEAHNACRDCASCGRRAKEKANYERSRETAPKLKSKLRAAQAQAGQSPVWGGRTRTPSDGGAESAPAPAQHVPWGDLKGLREDGGHPSSPSSSSAGLDRRAGRAAVGRPQSHAATPQAALQRSAPGWCLLIFASRFAA